MVEDGASRYIGIVEAMVDAAYAELCQDEFGRKIDDCVPNPEARTADKALGWNVKRAVASEAGVAIPESGLREDVEQGRGRAKHPDDVGGEGRGPAGEVCLMQIHPAVVWRFIPGLTEEERGAAAATKDMRETLARTLLGIDHDALVRCFRTGLRMLIRAKAHCDWQYSMWIQNAKQVGVFEIPVHDSWWPMFSMYATGSSCSSFNGLKTTVRRSVSERVAVELGRQRTKAEKAEAAMLGSKSD
jgi:hypothetical protein